MIGEVKNKSGREFVEIMRLRNNASVPSGMSFIENASVAEVDGM